MGRPPAGDLPERPAEHDLHLRSVLGGKAAIVARARGYLAAAKLAAIHPSRVPVILTELAQASLLSQPVAGRFALHGLLRAYALEQSERVDSVQQRVEATRRIVDQPEFQRRFRAGWQAHVCRW